MIKLFIYFGNEGIWEGKELNVVIVNILMFFLISKKLVIFYNILKIEKKKVMNVD